jgi:hypothetical protein
MPLGECPTETLPVFLTGQEEIDAASETLYSYMQGLGDFGLGLIILPLYLLLPSEMQSHIFEPAYPGIRKCVVATNFAEALLTIGGIYFVADPIFESRRHSMQSWTCIVWLSCQFHNPVHIRGLVMQAEHVQANATIYALKWNTRMKCSQLKFQRFKGPT